MVDGHVREKDLYVVFGSDKVNPLESEQQRKYIETS